MNLDRKRAAAIEPRTCERCGYEGRRRRSTCWACSVTEDPHASESSLRRAAQTYEKRGDHRNASKTRQRLPSSEKQEAAV